MSNELAPWYDDREKLDLIKRTLCPVGIPDGEFAMCMEKCRRLDMDPLSGEVFIIQRSQNIGTKENKQWVKKYEVQVAETGMARRAESFPDYRGMLGGVVYAGDDILIDNATGQVVKHLSNPLKAGEVKGAWAVCKRDGKVFPVEFVWLHEMRQDTGQWGKAAVMIYKCARSAALRRAFPEVFSGTYSKEEMLVHGATKQTDYVQPATLPSALESAPQLAAGITVEAIPQDAAPSEPAFDATTGELIGQAHEEGEDVLFAMHEKKVRDASTRAEKMKEITKAPAGMRQRLGLLLKEVR